MARDPNEIILNRCVLNGIEVINNGIDNLTVGEALRYIDKAREEAKGYIPALTISPESDGNIALDFTPPVIRFERIRRITGYLVGDKARWNYAKSAEEADRVKHSLSELNKSSNVKGEDEYEEDETHER